ncbi:UNVERIFIED_ORG: hypothetical protein M2348_000712 [Sphingomonas sp. R1F5B]
MSAQAISACGKIVETATRACAAPPPNPDAAQPNWDAMANSFASLSTAIAWGSVILAVIIFIAGLAWGKIVVATAEREAREMAQACAAAHIAKWLAEDAPPLIMRQAAEILRTLGSEEPISDEDLTDLVAAVGADGKEAEDEKK